MSKTHKQVIRSDAEREEEAPAHKTRRRLKQQLDELIELDDPSEDDFSEIETFERIRRKASR